MDEKICESCQQRNATTKCGVCGSMICTECKLDHGCKACNGGKLEF